MPEPHADVACVLTAQHLAAAESGQPSGAALLCRQVNVTCGGMTRSTAASKGASPEYTETLEYFLVAPQVQAEDADVSLEVRSASWTMSRHAL